MKLTWLAARNLRHHGRSYAAFFLSSTFAVWMFFLYGALVLHPDLPRLLGELNANSQVPIQFFVGIEVMVAGFAIFFVRYSHSAFLKARQTEIGMLTMLGMDRRRINRMILAEAMAIGLGAILLGEGLGLVFSKLFYLAMSHLMQISVLPFYLPWRAGLLTLLAFLAVFGLTAALSAFSLRRLSVADVLRSAGKPRPAPRFSIWLVLLCAGTLGAAYTMAFTANEHNADHRSWPILGLLLVGTYLLFTQGGVGILRFLQRRRWFYWRGTNLVTLAQMVYKVRDNANVLFMVAVLSSVALASVGLNYGALVTAARRAEADFQADVYLTGASGEVDPAELEADLNAAGAGVRQAFHIPMLKSSVVSAVQGTHRFTIEAPIVSAGAFNAWQHALGRPPVAVPAGSAAVLSPWAVMPEQSSLEILPPGAAVRWSPGQSEPVATVPAVRIAVAPPLPVTGMVLVDDRLFTDLQAVGGDSALHVYYLANWRRSETVVRNLQLGKLHNNGSLHGVSITGRAILYRNYLMGDSLFLFVSAFLGALFFLASGNMLYFKLWGDLNDDQRQFRSLYKLGLKVSEIRRIVSVQALVMFVAPLVVAIINGSLFVILFGAMYDFNLTGPVVLVAGGYSILFGAYYLIARQTYVAALLGRTL